VPVIYNTKQLSVCHVDQFVFDVGAQNALEIGIDSLQINILKSKKKKSKASL
jgi:hypothetical protein